MCHQRILGLTSICRPPLIMPSTVGTQRAKFTKFQASSQCQLCLYTGEVAGRLHGYLAKCSAHADVQPFHDSCITWVMTVLRQC